MFLWIFLCFNLCPLPLALSLSTTQNILSVSSFISPIRHLYMLMRFLREHSQSLRRAALVPARSAADALAWCAGGFPEPEIDCSGAELSQTNVLTSDCLHATDPFYTLLCSFPLSVPQRSPSPKHSLISFAQTHGPSLEYSESSLPKCSSLPPSYQLQSPGWSSPKLCLEFRNGPWISDQRLLIFHIVSFIPCLSGLCLCVFLFINSPFTYYSICIESDCDSINLMKQMLSPSTCALKFFYGSQINFISGPQKHRNQQ